MHAFARILGWSWLAIAFTTIELRNFDLVHIQYLIHTSRVRSNFADVKIVINIGFVPCVSVRALCPSMCVFLAAGIMFVLFPCRAGVRVFPPLKLSSDVRVTKRKKGIICGAIRARSGHPSDPAPVLLLDLYHRCVPRNLQASFFRFASP